MAHAEVVYEPKPEYIVQVGHEVQTPVSVHNPGERASRIEWEFHEAYSKEHLATNAADREARDHEHVRVIKRTSSDATSQSADLSPELQASLEKLAGVEAVAACRNHLPMQHRDAKPPWCNTCRRTADGRCAQCMMPIRETTDFVCENCGTYYSKG